MTTDDKAFVLKILKDVRHLYPILQEKARQIAPDYPNIDKGLEMSEYLWAITSSYEGLDMANKDWQAFCDLMLEKGILTQATILELWEELKAKGKLDYANVQRSRHQPDLATWAAGGPGAPSGH